MRVAFASKGVSLKAFIGLRSSMRDSAKLKVVCRVLRVTPANERIIIYCYVFLIELGFLHFFFMRNESWQGAWGFLLCVVALVLYLFNYMAMKSNAFLRDYPTEIEEIEHFQGGTEYFSFLLFLESCARKDLVKEEAFEECRRYLEIESHSKRPSFIGASPVFIVLAAVWANTYVKIFDIENIEVVGLGAAFLFFVTILFFQFAGGRFSSHRLIVKLEKYCSWFLEMPKERRREIEASVNVAAERRPPNQLWRWPFGGRSET